jgi:SsrA-binding protein
MAKKKKEKAPEGMELLVCRNPKVQQSFEIDERLEAGLVLQGSEVKALRAKRADIDGAYAALDPKGELYLHKVYIGPYEQAGPYHAHPERRVRKLLLHAHELKRLRGALSTRGYTLVPTQIYFKNGHAKVELALAKGKKKGDERQELKKKAELAEARAAVAKYKR